MKTVAVDWKELKKALRKANRLDKMTWDLKDIRERAFWQHKISNYCNPSDPEYRNEEYYKKIESGLSKAIDKS